MKAYESAFDLEKAMQAWRHTLNIQRTFLVDDLDELEDHLRNEIERRVASGMKPRQAFLSASNDLGSFVELDRMYEPVRFGRIKAGSSMIRDLRFSFSMAHHYILSSIRNVSRHLGQTLINVLGLSVALVVCVFLGLFVRHELSFDRFHEHKDQIFRVRTASDGNWTATDRAFLAERIAQNYPEVASTVRIFKHWETPLIAVGNEGKLEPGLYFADSTFFSIFSFPLLSGTAESVLTSPFSVVISESTAHRYFGNESAVGRRLTYNSGSELTVTGVMKDAPENSHIRPDMVVSLSTLPRVSYAGILDEWAVFHTYVLLRPSTRTSTSERTLSESVSAKITADLYEDNGSDITRVLDLQPLPDIYLHSGLANDLEVPGNARNVMMMGTLALLILLIAAFNHINLATARALRRTKEIAVRKVTGAKRHEIFQQFLVEALLQIGSAFVLGSLVVWFTQSTLGTVIGFDLLHRASLLLILGYAAGISVALALIAGSYPAIVMSNLGPASALKGSTGSLSTGGTLRKALVVVQFGVSAFLIAVTLIMVRQVQFIKSADLGFDTEGLVAIPIQGEEARSRYASLREGLLAVNGVEAVGASASTRPGKPHSQGHVLQQTLGDEDNALTVQRNWVDAHYLETIGATMLLGQSFSDLPGWNEKSILLNESALQKMGLPLSPEIIGMSVYLNPDSDTVPYTIGGVISDFNYESLHASIGPLVFTYNTFPTQLLVRINTADVQSTSVALETIWKQFTNQPFSFTFLDDELEDLYRQETQAGTMLTWSSGLAVFIAALGLLGLAAFMAETRKREIGIRKALGASATSIVLLISKETVQLVTIAIVLATPIAYFVIDRWLASFAYRTAITPSVFVFTALVLLGIASMTVGFHAGKSAISRPVDTLRSD